MWWRVSQVVRAAAKPAASSGPPQQAAGTSSSHRPPRPGRSRRAWSCRLSAEGPGGVAAAQLGRVAKAHHEGAGVSGGPPLRGARAGEVQHVAAEGGHHVVAPRAGRGAGTTAPSPDVRRR
jgi:hypothetical protein